MSRCGRIQYRGPAPFWGVCRHYLVARRRGSVCGGVVAVVCFSKQPPLTPDSEAVRKRGQGSKLIPPWGEPRPITWQPQLHGMPRPGGGRKEPVHPRGPLSARPGSPPAPNRLSQPQVSRLKGEAAGCVDALGMPPGAGKGWSWKPAALFPLSHPQAGHQDHTCLGF